MSANYQINYNFLIYLQTAPVDGHWNRWGSWNECSVTCNKGVQVRTRICNDPAPKNGGKLCVGSNKDKQTCKKKSCTAGMCIYM